MLVEKLDVGAYARNVYSQSGEDGILEELFRKLGIRQGYFVEFGAWDGKHLSNTYNFLQNGWSGVFIEGDPRKFKDLVRNLSSHNVHLVNRYVTVEGPDTLDNILAEVGVPAAVDLLSIDIDSDDLAVFMSLHSVRAKCVVIEYNPTIPFDTEFVNKRGRQMGNSALSIKRYAESIGYDLIAMTQNNLIFLQKDLALQAGIKTRELERTENLNAYRYFFGFDGTLICLDMLRDDNEPEAFTIPWQHYRMHQPIPRSLRAFDHKRPMAALQVFVSLCGLWSRPGTLFREVRYLIFEKLIRTRS